MRSLIFSAGSGQRARGDRVIVWSDGGHMTHEHEHMVWGEAAGCSAQILILCYSHGRGLEDDDTRFGGR